MNEYTHFPCSLPRRVPTAHATFNQGLIYMTELSHLKKNETYIRSTMYWPGNRFPPTPLHFFTPSLHFPHIFSTCEMGRRQNSYDAKNLYYTLSSLQWSDLTSNFTPFSHLSHICLTFFGLTPSHLTGSISMEKLNLTETDCCCCNLPIGLPYSLHYKSPSTTRPQMKWSTLNGQTILGKQAKQKQRQTSRRAPDAIKNYKVPAPVSHS